MSSILSRIKAFFQGGRSSSGTSREGGTRGTSLGLQNGTLVHFNWSKGYGFVESPAVEGRIFLHRSRLKRRMKVGDSLRFELGQNAKGYFVMRIQDR
ncbi:MAG: cold shock domain-containing protein [Saprospiraceae bacterium]|nr:cold shock domain-containing protein [Saprospiraceae bacterium]